MIKKIKNMNKLWLYSISILVTYIILIILNLFFGQNPSERNEIKFEYKKNNIEEVSELYSIKVSYPRYSSDDISSIITDYVYNYVSTFKKSSEKSNKKETLEINYEVQEINDFTNILFSINNSLIPGEKYKSILLDKNNKKEIFINSLYGNNILSEIKEMFYKKYPENIYNKVNDLTLKDFNFSFKDAYINVYVNKNILSTNAVYDIYVSKIIDEKKYVFEEEKADKYIAITFDDGPSEYTTEIVDAFVSNNSKATFFMLGNRMKALKSVVKYVKDNNMQIGSHTYSHKRLTALTIEEALEEINSSVIVYNEITNEDLTLLRPPYGSINDEIMSLSAFPLITWSIDTKDWLNKDAQYIKNYVLETVYDGAIVLMHDIYPTSKEAIKMLIPELINMGYKLVTISELAEIKGKKLIPGQIVREIK